MSPLIVANWKMNTTLSEAMILANGIKKGLADIGECEVVLCPPFPWLVPLAEVIHHHPLHHLSLGAQNIHYKEFGPYTGEVSATMLKSVVKYVIIGHSERRRFARETHEEIEAKIKQALKQGLWPIVCIGEPRRPKSELLENPNELSIAHLHQPLDELHDAFRHLSKGEAEQVIVAYEPLWAISTSKDGEAATGLYANRVAQIFQQRLVKYVGASSSTHPVLYGGSVTPANAREFSHQPSIAGFLVGGASLRIRDFLSICRNAVS